MSHVQTSDERPGVPPGPGDPTDKDIGDAFSAAFNGEPTSGMDPYVRLVSPAVEDDSREARGLGGVTPGSSRAQVFDPNDIERREYRLLARALTNDDDVTDQLAAMTLVQLVKLLRAAGVSVPGFAETPNTPDPGSGDVQGRHRP
jgi:hypothetical protein